MPLIYDMVDPQELLGFVRSLAFPNFTLDQFLPNRPIDDLEYRFMKADLVDQDMAPFRAWDTEAPIGKRQGLSRVTGELPPLSKKIRLGEEERLRLRALESGNQAPLIAQIYDDAASMTRAVQARIEKARGEALYDGKVVINENSMQATVDFNIPAGNRVAPATLWSVTATATPVTDVRTWVEAYVALNGIAPGVALTSTRVVSNLMKNAEIRTLAGSLAGTPAMVTPETVGAVFAAYGLPPFVTYDTQVRVDGVSTRVIPDDRVVFLPPAGEPLGQTFYGVTAEALELRSEGKIVATQAPGVVAVLEKTFDPVATWTKAAAIALPVIANPGLIITADVL